uniref:FimD/PapC C-terminal domain-containing protein n=1 Tax=Escherichia coli TaxID=562 RepID=UPI000BE4EFE1|nr:FimD/PapC C-terminal domain-containing protein [Escherichia coli]
MLPSETMIWQPEFTDKTLSRKPGAVQNPIPFGAIVRVVSDSDNMSIVGDDGVVYLTAMKDTGVIEVVWGDRNNQKSRKIGYSLNDTPTPAGVYFAKTAIIK